LSEDVVKVLGGNQSWTPAQVKRAERFSESYPREWWALEQLPDGELRDQLTYEVAAGTMSKRNLSYLWQTADRIEAVGQETASGIKSRTRPEKGDLVEVFGTADRIVYERGRMQVEFHSQSGWLGRVIIANDDDRFLRDILPEDEVRITGLCLSNARSSSRSLIGDRPAGKKGVSKVMTIKVWDRPGGWDT